MNKVFVNTAFFLTSAHYLVMLGGACAVWIGMDAIGIDSDRARVVALLGAVAVGELIACLTLPPRKLLRRTLPPFHQDDGKRLRLGAAVQGYAILSAIQFGLPTLYAFFVFWPSQNPVVQVFVYGGGTIIWLLTLCMGIVGATDISRNARSRFSRHEPAEEEGEA